MAKHKLEFENLKTFTFWTLRTGLNGPHCIILKLLNILKLLVQSLGLFILVFYLWLLRIELWLTQFGLMNQTFRQFSDIFDRWTDTFITQYYGCKTFQSTSFNPVSIAFRPADGIEFWVVKMLQLNKILWFLNTHRK